MRLFYGWVIVAVGIIVGCISMGGVMSLGVFLQPMAELRGHQLNGRTSNGPYFYLIFWWHTTLIGK